ncbi:MAG: PQQ-dependent sugar dehydrogenase [Verrucomicrobiota bacterium]
MNHRHVLAGFCALILSAPTVLAAERVDRLYAQYCASCHGDKLQGGAGPSLLGPAWKHGADDESLKRSILKGQPDAGMPGFAAMLDEAATRGLVIFIREAGQRAANATADTPAPFPDTVTRSEEHAYRLETVATGLESPWGMAWLPDGRMLVTERAGPLRIVGPDGLEPEAIQGTPEVWARGQGGLLAVSVHPEYTQNGWIYLGFSDPAEDGRAMTAIVRGRIRDGVWVDQEDIFRAPRDLYRNSGVHFGTRIVFQDGYLFFSIGDRGAQQQAQDLSRPNGKVHRLHDDGRVPADNPFVKTPGALPSIWSYGNRNPQGLALHPATGELWSTEHGPRGGDELNLIQPGRNYGWPAITHGMNYNGTPITAETNREGMEQPVVHWTPSLAVCGIGFYTGDAFPEWQNQLFVTSLAAQELRRVVVDNQRRAVHQEVIFKGIGRLRDVATGPDGLLYVSMENPGRIVRLKP